MTTRRWLYSLGLTALFTAPVQAADFSDRAVGLCEKIKDCAMDQAQSQSLPPEALEMMQPMLDASCEAMRHQFGNVDENQQFADSAMQCIESIEALSCAEMMNGESVQTPECQAHAERVTEAMKSE